MHSFRTLLNNNVQKSQTKLSIYIVLRFPYNQYLLSMTLL